MTVRVTVDRVPDVLDAIKKLTSKEVLVGIPSFADARDDGEIGNAARAYIHEFGSPAANIPARPFLIPGVESIRDQAIARLKKAGQQALDGNVAQVDAQFTAVGEMAVSAVQKRLTEGPFVPLKEATKRARLARTAAYKAASPARRAKMMAQWLGGDFTPLIDTGAMRAAIRYVIAKKGK